MRKRKKTRKLLLKPYQLEKKKSFKAFAKSYLLQWGKPKPFAPSKARQHNKSRATGSAIQ